MIDFHSHVLPKMDDGAKSVEVAVAMLEEIGFPKELIINSSRERLEAFLETKGLSL